MARNQEKAQHALNRYIDGKREELEGPKATRPYLASLCDTVPECEKWRMEIVREVGKKVSMIQNGARAAACASRRTPAHGSLRTSVRARRVLTRALSTRARAAASSCPHAEGLAEHKIRDLNDQINKLLREKHHWEKRIKELGGPDYAVRARRPHPSRPTLYLAAGSCAPPLHAPRHAAPMTEIGPTDR